MRLSVFHINGETQEAGESRPRGLGAMVVVRVRIEWPDGFSSPIPSVGRARVKWLKKTLCTIESAAELHGGLFETDGHGGANIVFSSFLLPKGSPVAMKCSPEEVWQAALGAIAVIQAVARRAPSSASWPAVSIGISGVTGPVVSARSNAPKSRVLTIGSVNIEGGVFSSELAADLANAATKRWLRNKLSHREWDFFQTHLSERPIALIHRAAFPKANTKHFSVKLSDPVIIPLPAGHRSLEVALLAVAE